MGAVKGKIVGIYKPYVYIDCTLLVDEGIVAYLYHRAGFDSGKFGSLVGEALQRGAKEMIRELLAAEIEGEGGGT